MKKIILAVAVMAFVFSPVFVSQAEAGQGKHKHVHFAHHKKHHKHHKKH